jgi:pilus assembly protein CpaE
VANIFVIDDDDQLLRMVGLMLERGGHEAVLISNPFKGVERVEAEIPDLLVLDVMMPGLSGHDICRQIRNNPATAHLPILILTARAQEVDRAAALRSGANDYLSKPVNSQELIQRVTDLLARSRVGKEPPGDGMVISIFGLRGGIGRTTVAVNLAGALRRTSQEDICLLDLSPSGGQATTHLRLKTSSHWGFLPDTGEFGWEMVRNNLLVHPSGLLLLAAPALPQAVDRPTVEAVNRLLFLLKENMSAIVIDLPAVLSPAVNAALAVSDLVLHLVAPEVVSVQAAVQAQRFLAASGLTIKRRSHILNQVTAEAQLPPATVERGLGATLSFQIGYDSNQPRALAQGAPLALSPVQSPVSVTIRRMAEAVWERVQHGQG